jgi:hypothetical protein
MYKRLKKISLVVIGLYVGLSVFHVWQNIGFEKLGLGGLKTATEATRFRVGFLPVT